MEHLEGESLAKMLRARGALPIDEALALADEICCGLAAAHALGIVHRDLKPSNVFVTRQPDGSRRVKIVDFGVAKKLATKTGSDEDDGALTSSTTVLGSPFYMAPEQVRSARDVDARADLWSLGATLYEMLSGKPPFVAETTPGVLAAVVADRPRALRESIPAIPRRLEAVVMRCLEKNRDARWADVESLRAALAEVPSRTDQEIAASTPPEAHDATKEKDEKNEAARRRKRTIALGAAALAVVVVGGRLLLGTNASAEAPMRPFVATSTAEGTIAATPPAAPVPAPIEAKIEASPHVTEPVATTSKETAERREPTSHRKTAPRASPSPSPTPTATPSAMPSQTAPAPVAAPPASFTPRPDVSAATADRH
jgi:serine/threonine-protein kinase